MDISYDLSVMVEFPLPESGYFVGIISFRHSRNYLSNLYEVIRVRTVLGDPSCLDLLTDLHFHVCETPSATCYRSLRNLALKSWLSPPPHYALIPILVNFGI